MILVDGLCQSYHWSMKEAMSLTLPQIIMLNHAAWVNQEQGKKRYEAKQRREKKADGKPLTMSDIVVDGKPMDEMTSEEIAQHVTTWE